MSNLFRGVKSKLYHLKGASVEDVISAEKKLGLHFSEDYRNYLLEYGCVSFGSHEFLGLGGDSYLDVVEETLREQKNNAGFPITCYMVESIGVDGIQILQDENGHIYELSSAGMKRIYDDLESYILSISN